MSKWLFMKLLEYWGALQVSVLDDGWVSRVSLFESLRLWSQEDGLRFILGQWYITSTHFNFLRRSDSILQPTLPLVPSLPTFDNEWKKDNFG